MHTHTAQKEADEKTADSGMGSLHLHMRCGTQSKQRSELKAAAITEGDAQ